MSEEEIIKLQKDKEEIEKSRDSWKTWGIISIIGAVFCFIVAVLLMIFIFKYRGQLKACKNEISDSFNSMSESMKNRIGNRLSSLGDKIKVSGGCDCTKGGCGACVAGGCGCDMTGGCDCSKGGCGMTGGGSNSSNFLNKLLKK